MSFVLGDMGAIDYGEPVTVVYTLVGGSDGLMKELSLSLKSIIANLGPPLRGQADHVRIYLICDTRGMQLVETWAKAELGEGFPLASGALVDLFPVVISDGQLSHWQGELEAAVVPWKLSNRHSFGTYLRLFLHHIIPKPHPRSENFVIYLDTDVVFLTDIRLLFQERKPGALVQFGPTFNAGVLILGLAHFEDAFKALSEVASLWTRKIILDDQILLSQFAKIHPDRAGSLSARWDGTLNEHWEADDLFNQKTAVAVLHYNGGGSNTNPFFEYKADDWIYNGQLDWMGSPGWRVAYFYADLPWSWLRQYAEWRIGEG
eukprot:CAMPEP_0119145484 /NCGR_PEP_ID=MMETSP1310-20130426/37600_1 /TAXON_ID=464262 /ORGANISM="Genus nov. species nov., Strain RCC2339" /LENGTH=317 /DNA_ID=CAMNT_0007137303 /DNA_START=185 /DNA_END=1134 /DNA_ORIENTATION=+